jgi:hypothetical protein
MLSTCYGRAIVYAVASYFIAAPLNSLAAATVFPVRGEVRISTDQGFRKIDAATELPVTATVLVSPGGLATIRYDQTCVVHVESIAFIQKLPPCQGYHAPAYMGLTHEGSISPDDADYGFTPKVGGHPPAKPNDNCTFDDHTLLIIGGVAVIGGVAAALLLNQGSSAPASP